MVMIHGRWTAWRVLPSLPHSPPPPRMDPCLIPTLRLAAWNPWAVLLTAVSRDWFYLSLWPLQQPVQVSFLLSNKFSPNLFLLSNKFSPNLSLLWTYAQRILPKFLSPAIFSTRMYHMSRMAAFPQMYAMKQPILCRENKRILWLDELSKCLITCTPC